MNLVIGPKHTDRRIDLHVALNYGQATGSVQLLRFLTEHTEVWVTAGSGSPD